MPTSDDYLETDQKPDSPEWWNRQLTYIMDETYHALKQAVESKDRLDPKTLLSWTNRAEYLREMAIKCVNNAYKSIQLQIEEEKK